MSTDDEQRCVLVGTSGHAAVVTFGEAMCGVSCSRLLRPPWWRRDNISIVAYVLPPGRDRAHFLGTSLLRGLHLICATESPMHGGVVIAAHENGRVRSLGDGHLRHISVLLQCSIHPRTTAMRRVADREVDREESDDGAVSEAPPPLQDLPVSGLISESAPSARPGPKSVLPELSLVTSAYNLRPRRLRVCYRYQ